MNITYLKSLKSEQQQKDFGDKQKLGELTCTGPGFLFFFHVLGHCLEGGSTLHSCKAVVPKTWIETDF